MRQEQTVDAVTEKEIRVNFAVARSAIENLRHDLTPFAQETSYIFIKQNINSTIAYLRDQIELVLEKAEKFENVCLSSSLLSISFKEDPIVVYEFRDIYREFTEITKLFLAGIKTNVGKVLSAYIVAYEILEKFDIHSPFVVVESDRFSCQYLRRFALRAFTGILENVDFSYSPIEVITYSAVDIDDPLSLLLFGHEIFHVVEKKEEVHAKFCHSNDIPYAERDKEAIAREREAFVDIMAGLYFGPAYTSALVEQFKKIYPLSGTRHPEINVRLLSLAFLQTVQTPRFDSENSKSLNEFIELIESRMDSTSTTRAQEDRKSLEIMFSKNVINYVNNYFESKEVTTYKDFLDVEARESKGSVDKLDRRKIRAFLRTRIPAAARPTTLLNVISETAELKEVKSSLIVSSMKKWYVKRYYQKSREHAST